MPKAIMVFNDTEAILRLFGEILTDAGYEVTLHMYNARDVAEVARQQPALLISDHLPTDDNKSWLFLHKLKMTPETAHIPVIVSTTYDKGLREQEAWLSSKGIVILPKPFVLNDVLGAVALQIGPADV